MKVVTDGAEVIDLGTTEITPTIGITDSSRRVTDDFGVTTVVERGFARRMSVRLTVPFDDVDALQSRLANLRAVPALWIADDRFQSLAVRGFYKDFSLDLAVPPISYCTLTIEGLTETGPFVDVGGDPAPEGQASTLQLLQPVAVAGDVLVATSVAEADHSEWSASTAYSVGSRVIKKAEHRIYESVANGNVDHDPVGVSGKWLDVGPTNRWAMFDRALGSSTDAAGTIKVTLDAGLVGAVALLDVTGATVRVQSADYDRTAVVSPGAITFLDLPATGGQITVTVAGPGQVSVGTLLVGPLVGLGLTEAAPTAGITDYSRKEIDDFGEVTIAQRAWAKRMTARSLIRTEALDAVAGRIAAVRATPALWVGSAGVDSLTVYGFFKDFSIEVGEATSKLSLSIEGLSTAPKSAPPAVKMDWLEQAAFASDVPPENFEGALWFNRKRGNRPYVGSGFGITIGGVAVTIGGETEIGMGFLDVQDEDAAESVRRINALDDDGVLTIPEKIATLIPRDATLEAARLILDAEAATLQIGPERAAVATARAAWLAVRDAISPPWNDVTAPSPVARDGFRAALTEYDASLTALRRATVAVAATRAQWAGVTGEGTPEANADVTSLVAGSKVVQIAYDYAGAVKPGQLPIEAAFKLLTGSADVTGEAVWSATRKSGNAAFTVGAATGVLSVTAMTVDSLIEVAAVRNGKTRFGSLQLVRADGAAPATGTGTGGTGTGSSASTSTIAPSASATYGAANTAVLTVAAGSSGTVDLSFPSSFTRRTNGTSNAAGKWQWRAVAGVWGDVAPEIAGELPAIRRGAPEPANDEGYIAVTMSKTGLTAGTAYEFQLLLRTAGNAGTVDFQGTASAVGS